MFNLACVFCDKRAAMRGALICAKCHRDCSGDAKRKPLDDAPALVQCGKCGQYYDGKCSRCAAANANAKRRAAKCADTAPPRRRR